MRVGQNALLSNMLYIGGSDFAEYINNLRNGDSNGRRI